MAKIGKGYKETMIALKRYKETMAKYIESQQEDGYIAILSVNEDDVIAFTMGQYSFITQFNCIHHHSTIYIKTFIKSRPPERESYLHIPEMDIACEGVSDRYNGVASFKVEKVIEEWGRETKVSYLQDFNVEYIYFLDRFIKGLYERKREQA